MDNMRNSQIISVIDALSRLVDLDKFFVTEKLREYSSMSDKEVMKDLSFFVYSHFKDDKELCVYFLNLISNINPSIAPSSEFMISELEKMFLNQNGKMSLEENHEFIMKTFKDIVYLFEKEGIDYCIVGALPCFLQKDIPLFRYHDDINVFVNEDDLEKVKSIIENYGYIYQDLRFPSVNEFQQIKENRPPHLVMASNPNNEFHIGFFIFRREKDNGITTFDYLQRENNNEVIIDRLERTYSRLATELRFNNNYSVDGLNAKVCSPEHVYEIKSYTKRPKDVTDMNVLEKYIDKDKLKELRRNTNTKQIIKNIQHDNQMKM